MEQTFEQDIPIAYIIAGFIVLMILSNLLRIKLRNRKLILDGQITTEGGRALSVEERVSRNPAWARGEIRSKGRMKMVLLWITAIAMNLTLTFSFIKSFSNPAIKMPAVILLGFLSLLAIGFAGFAIYATLQYFRFGESICKIQGKTGVLGKAMKGAIRNSREIIPTGDYTIQLQCVETYSVGSGKNRKTKTQILWHEKQRIPHKEQNIRTGINFSFDLPSSTYETGYQLSRGDINWQLTIHAPVEGVDYSALFLVPVFRVD